MSTYPEPRQGDLRMEGGWVNGVWEGSLQELGSFLISMGVPEDVRKDLLSANCPPGGTVRASRHVVGDCQIPASESGQVWEFCVSYGPDGKECSRTVTKRRCPKRLGGTLEELRGSETVEEGPVVTGECQPGPGGNVPDRCSMKVFGRCEIPAREGAEKVVFCVYYGPEGKECDRKISSSYCGVKPPSPAGA